MAAQPSDETGAIAPPPELTREEVVARLAALGVETTERQLRSWVSHSILPRPERKRPPGATGGHARAVFPAWIVPVVQQLLADVRLNNASLEELRAAAPGYIATWEAHAHEGRLPAGLVIARGDVVSPPAAASGAGRVTPAPPLGLRRAVWAYLEQVAAAGQGHAERVDLRIELPDGRTLPVEVKPPPRPRGYRRRAEG